MTDSIIKPQGKGATKRLFYEWLKNNDLVLTRDGVIQQKDSKYPDEPEPNEALQKQIQLLWDIKTRFTGSTGGSYGMKHVIEEYRNVFQSKVDSYVTNGDFILNFFEAFPSTGWKVADLNVYFPVVKKYA